MRNTTTSSRNNLNRAKSPYTAGVPHSAPAFIIRASSGSLTSLTHKSVVWMSRFVTCVRLRSGSEADIAGGCENVEKEIAEQLVVGLT